MGKKNKKQIQEKKTSNNFEQKRNGKFVLSKKSKIVTGVTILFLLVIFSLGSFFWLVWEGKIINNTIIKISQSILDKFYPQEKLTIGWVTDAKCYGEQNKDTGERELNWRCIDPLESMA